MKRIALFASGSGTNAENIIFFARKTKAFEITKIYCNKASAGIIQRGQSLDVPVVVFSRNCFYNTSVIVDDLKKDGVDAVILAGFLWLIPNNLLAAFENKIINIHPALLPKFGGKGMYGAKVHEAVIAQKESESGITIHLVNQEYDRGETLFQAKCEVLPTDTPDSLAQKVHALEYEHFPAIISQFIQTIAD